MLLPFAKHQFFLDDHDLYYGADHTPHWVSGQKYTGSELIYVGVPSKMIRGRLFIDTNLQNQTKVYLVKTSQFRCR